MGSKKKIYVASQVWNLAGAMKDRPSFKKLTIIGGVLGEAKYLGNHISSSYRTGPYAKFRSFEKWCRNKGYNDFVHFEVSDLIMSNVTNINPVTAYVERLVGANDSLRALVNDVAVGTGSLEWFIENYLINNYGNEIEEGWDLLDPGDPDDQDTFTVKFTKTQRTISFTLNVPDLSRRYMYVKYSTSVVTKTDEDTIEEVEGTPNVNGFVLVNTSGLISTNIKLYKHVWVKEYDPDTGEETQATHTVEETDVISDFQSWYYESTAPNYTIKIDTVTGQPVTGAHRIYYTKQSKVETITTIEDHYDSNGKLSYRIEIYEDIIHHNKEDYRKYADIFTGGTPDQIKSFIYEYGSGETSLDAVMDSGAKYLVMDKFVPCISFIHEKKELKGTQRKWAERAFKKATKSKYKKTLKAILENDDVKKNVNYVFTNHGVSLNTTSLLCKRYIYEFFKKIGPSEINGHLSPMDIYRNQWELADNSVKAYNQWVAENEGHVPGYDQYISDPPPVIPYPKLPSSSFFIKSDPTFHNEMKWSDIYFESGSGLYKEGFKKGSVEINKLAGEVIRQGNKTSTNASFSFSSNNLTRFEVICQEDNNYWGRVIVTGATHKNIVYKSKAVVIDSDEALDEPVDGDDGTGESGFLVPLSVSLLKEIGIVKGTQMTSEGHYLVFNSYKVVKKKWYQTGLFKVIVIVIYIVFTVFTAGAGAVVGPGIFGTTAAVTSAMVGAGMSLAMATVVGMVANAMVGMVISALVGKVATKLFGAQLGAIIGTIVGIALASGFDGGFSFNPAKAFSELMKAPNLLKLTQSVIQEVGNYRLEKIQDKTKAVMDKYEKDRKEIISKYEDTFGSSQANLSYAVTNALLNATRYESPDEFLSRTLMTGSDIAELTQSQITDYVDMHLTLRLP